MQQILINEYTKDHSVTLFSKSTTLIFTFLLYRQMEATVSIKNLILKVFNQKLLIQSSRSMAKHIRFKRRKLVKKYLFFLWWEKQLNINVLFPFQAVNIIESKLPFSHDERLGFLTFCPTNLGTTIRASVHIKVPKLAKNKAQLEAIATKFNLQVRG